MLIGLRNADTMFLPLVFPVKWAIVRADYVAQLAYEYKTDGFEENNWCKNKQVASPTEMRHILLIANLPLYVLRFGKIYGPCNGWSILDILLRQPTQKSKIYWISNSFTLHYNLAVILRFHLVRTGLLKISINRKYAVDLEIIFPSLALSCGVHSIKQISNVREEIDY